MEEFMKATYATALNAGIDIVPLDTAARIMAILCVWGNNENFVYSPKFNVEREFIQKRYGLEGGETPDKDFVESLRFYVNSLEAQKDSADPAPQWARDLLEKRYGFKLIC